MEIFVGVVFSNVYFLIFAYLVAAGFAISGLDDLFFDAIYLNWQLYRLRHGKILKNFNSKSLRDGRESRIAIFVPCWRESNVIGFMVRSALRKLVYENFTIVIGVYPNDIATVRTVKQLVKHYPNKVRMVVNSKPGPTTKADNLNSMFDDLKEIDGTHPFEIIVLHDSEDMIHPFSLRVFNYLIGVLNKDMVQIPVLPWSQPATDLVHWTYADEFAESHLRHLIVRERIHSFVPSAGVGTGYRRSSLESLRDHHARIFNPDSLTEDYNSGIELHHRGHGTIFAVMRDPDGEVVATRSIFPHAFKAAVKQKTRWIIGIALQGWREHGWRGQMRTKYTLFRDRKQLLTGALNVFGYLVLLPFFVLPVFFNLDPIEHIPASLWYLFVFDTFLFVWRVIMRMTAVTFFYGFGHSILVIVRYFIANLINFVAMIRALHIYFVQLKGKFIPWDKTPHEFPSGKHL